MKKNEKSMSELAEDVPPFIQLNDCTIGKELTKLERLDNAHTSEYNLHIDQVEKSIANISQALNIKNEKKNIINGDKLIDCYKISKTHEFLKCNDEVKKFIQQIDKFMYKAVRPDSESDSLWKKRITYTELFNPCIKMVPRAPSASVVQW
ncbi:hypothetical protein PV326_011889 [Microctonus aethiopoides]|nr:hypothetical protein PV326_011889 [Microctonus aethiopoides]